MTINITNLADKAKAELKAEAASLSNKFAERVVAVENIYSILKPLIPDIDKTNHNVTWSDWNDYVTITPGGKDILYTVTSSGVKEATGLGLEDALFLFLKRYYSFK